MRHLNAGRKLNRSSSHRKALLRNMVTSLLQHEHLQTTDAKAKELRRWVDRMITLGKRNTLHARRQARGLRARSDVVKKLFDDIAPRFADRPGGYTRITKLGSRHGDAAPMSLIELVERGDRARSEAEKKTRAPPPHRAEAGRSSSQGGTAARLRRRRPGCWLSGWFVGGATPRTTGHPTPNNLAAVSAAPESSPLPGPCRRRWWRGRSGSRGAASPAPGCRRGARRRRRPDGRARRRRR